MEIHSPGFLFLVVVFFVWYWLIKPKQRQYFLLGSSVFFITFWQPLVGIVALLVTLLSFCSAQFFSRIHSKVGRRSALAAAIVLTIAPLLLFKYARFIIDLLPGGGFAEWSAQFVSNIPQLLPIGISFYSFQAIGYCVDVYRNKNLAAKNIFQYAHSLIFFPKFIAGPIEKSTTFISQFSVERSFSYAKAVSGAQLLAIGLFKKLVIADNLRVVVDTSFSSIEQYKGLSLWVIIFLYAWQIYADFSGYTDIARGISRLFGIELSHNFRQPYFATSVRDFWQRWHISLSHWLKEYIYIPLGGSRAGVSRTYLNLCIVFVVCGFWHGAAWTFIIWGLFHGIVLGIERFFHQAISKTSFKEIAFPRAIAIPYAFAVVTLSWILFRAENIDQALYIVTNMLVGIKNTADPSYIHATLIQIFRSNYLEMALAFSAVSIMIILDVVMSSKTTRVSFGRLHPFVRFSAYTMLIVAILLGRSTTVSEFIYVRF